ncbi:MAG: sulfatase, partial [Planctomycetes bacterium]|nr:sulfatase [Planctomycetota bacterium]
LETGQQELYDLTRDLHEQHDLSATQPARVQSLESELRAHSRSNESDRECAIGSSPPTRRGS